MEKEGALSSMCEDDAGGSRLLVGGRMPLLSSIVSSSTGEVVVMQEDEEEVGEVEPERSDVGQPRLREVLGNRPMPLLAFTLHMTSFQAVGKSDASMGF